MYNILDSHYKKAIEISGVKATINNAESKILVKEASDEYGIDYKKIISSTSFNQGDYVYINGVQFLICDKEEKMAQSVYNVGTFRKTLPVLLGSTYKPIQVIIDKNSTVLNENANITDVHDQYKFVIPKLNNKTELNQQIIYDGGIYKTISIDSTRDGIYINIAKFESEYNPHVYEISLSETTTTIVEGATYQISNVICKDNGTIVPNPTLTYTSSDTSIASVDDKGLVIGVKTGNCNISVNYNNTIATLSLVVNVKPHDQVLSYSAVSSNGYSYRVKEGATLSYVKTIDSIIDNTLDISFSLDSVGQQFLNSSSISVVKKTNTTLQVRNLTVTTVKSFVLTVTDNSNGKVIATHNITTRSA